MKAQTYLKVIMLISITCLAMSSYGQDKELQKAKQQQRNFYRQSLQLDSVKAEQVAQIQESYKTSLKLVMADSTLNEAGRRVKVQGLMGEKNQQLRKLLNPAQQEKMIPSSERLYQPLKKD